jgi:predicted transcriptional regulator of viral defense system
MALNALIDDRNGRYQVSGPNAFSRYGFTEQIPARTYVYNNRLYGEKRIGSVELTLIKVADSRLGLTEQAVSPDGTAILYASRVRTLVDAVYDWSRFGSLPQAYEWIRADLRKERITAEELIEACIAFGDIGARRRIGYLLERLQVGEKQLRRVEKTLRSTSAFIPWIPTKPKRGPLVRRWGVVDNGPQ